MSARRGSLRGVVKHLGLLPVRALGYLCFPRRYLRGRHFEPSTRGWHSVWWSIWLQKVLGFNRHVPWPVSPFIAIGNPDNLTWDVDDLNNFQTFGCYFQNCGAKIHLGRGTCVAPNVGIISASHDPLDPEAHLPAEDVVIGENCWIGMNAVNLPGVRLGDGTTAGAGAVVTRNFLDGHCILGGVSAGLIRAGSVGEGPETASEDTGEP